MYSAQKSVVATSGLMAGVMIIFATHVAPAATTRTIPKPDTGHSSALRVITNSGRPAEATGTILASPRNHPAKNVRIAWVRTQPDGTVEFPEVPVSTLQRYAVKGHVNLELAVSSGRYFGDRNYGIDLPNSGKVSLRPVSDPNPTASVGSSEGQASIATQPSSLDPAGTLTLQPWAGSHGIAAKVPCATGEIPGTRFNAKTALVVARSDTKGIVVHYNYVSGSSSTLGVGVSPTGSFGTFSYSGTRSLSNDSGLTFDNIENASKVLWTYARYAQFRDFLYTDKGGQGICRVLAKPIGFAVGTDKTNAGGFSVAQSNCAPFAKNTGYSGHTQRAVTWSDGVSSAASLGLNLSSQTGYSDEGRLDYTFGKRGELCGQYAYPGDNGVFVGSYLAR